MDKEDLNKVFVYGSLKRGGNIRGSQMFKDAINVGQAQTTAGIYSMYDLGAFPGVTLDGKHDINGEVLLIDDKTLADFDMIEGYPDFYDKTEVETTEGKAIMYYLPNDRITDNQGNPAYFKNEESDQITATSKMLTWNL